MCLLIKYIKSVLWRVAKCLFYIEEARCLKVNNIIFETGSGVLKKRKKGADDNLKFSYNTVDSQYFELLGKTVKSGSDERIGCVSCQV